jgi:hypothetical protein
MLPPLCVYSIQVIKCGLGVEHKQIQPESVSGFDNCESSIQIVDEIPSILKTHTDPEELRFLPGVERDQALVVAQAGGVRKEL